MKIPKTVIIGGRKWKVKINPKEGGGHFEGNKSMISVGRRDGERQALHYFVHETLEAILLHRMLRYQRHYVETTNGDYIFVFDHHEFESICDDLTLALFGEGK